MGDASKASIGKCDWMFSKRILVSDIHKQYVHDYNGFLGYDAE